MASRQRNIVALALLVHNEREISVAVIRLVERNCFVILNNNLNVLMFIYHARKTAVIGYKNCHVPRSSFAKCCIRQQQEGSTEKPRWMNDYEIY